ncbi:hypothetical protein [Burkholderia pseudomallei]|uniref:hypothetical protein n=1 Tax=Burkholderia pseudomallei TaxID=28450 RepID=UPI000E6A110F|nr:hypothetical protein [Burkholderia pseudomallei]RIV77684.1 hypothetical protein D2W72_02375 [Burkholderia pseudomallei]RIV88511.1 hypothetical protein D2V84_00205 [Burkholderia pseudomallei]
MQINRKTRNIAKYLDHLQPSELYMLGLAVDADVDVEKRLEELGFGIPLVPGQSLLPPTQKGPACRRNAAGYDIVHRDKPMETAYRQIEWHWTQFVGRYGTEEMSKIVDVPYQRYPRTHVAPYSVELEIKVREDGKVFVVAGPFANELAHAAVATNTANMLRETLGGFEVLGKNLSDWVSAPVRRLHWHLLPPGKNPWESARPALEKLIERVPAGNQGVLRARLTAVGNKKPDFVAVGIGGFQGYTVFGFVKQGLCVLESPHVNNATYVLPMESWENVSQMTKAQILDARAHKARIVHTRSWFDALEQVLGGGRKAA